MHTVETEWVQEMTFDSQVTGHDVTMDAAKEFGGRDRGPRPKQLLLAALAGCTGMDVMSILGKMKVELDGFRIVARANLTDEHPRVYSKIELVYEFSGEDLPMEKITKAVELSQEKYCGISAMLRMSCPLSYEIETVA